MRVDRMIAGVLSSVLLLTASPVWADSKRVRHLEVGEGQRFCPQRTLVLSGTAVRGGRCYVLAALRDRRGAFIAFLDPSVRIPGRRAIRLDSEEGRKARGRILLLVPMSSNARVVLIPVNTIQLIRLREDDEEDEDEQEEIEGDRHPRVVSSSLTIILTTSPTPNTLVTFVINF
jgi:hypothetical protein